MLALSLYCFSFSLNSPNLMRALLQTLVQQFILGHAKILFVNVLMIGQNIRFKAILSHFETFFLLLWVANPLKL